MYYLLNYTSVSIGMLDVYYIIYKSVYILYTTYIVTIKYSLVLYTYSIIDLHVYTYRETIYILMISISIFLLYGYTCIITYVQYYS